MSFSQGGHRVVVVVQGGQGVVVVSRIGGQGGQGVVVVVVVVVVVSRIGGHGGQRVVITQGGQGVVVVGQGGQGVVHSQSSARAPIDGGAWGTVQDHCVDGTQVMRDSINKCPVGQSRAAASTPRFEHSQYREGSSVLR